MKVLYKTAPLLKVVFSVFWGGCKKKIDRFRPTFLADDRKKVGRNSVSPACVFYPFGVIGYYIDRKEPKTSPVRRRPCLYLSTLLEPPRPGNGKPHYQFLVLDWLHAQNGCLKKMHLIRQSSPFENKNTDQKMPNPKKIFSQTSPHNLASHHHHHRERYQTHARRAL